MKATTIPLKINKPTPSREQAKEAVKTILEYIGEDPKREGLLMTPDRVIDSFGELYAGYELCPGEQLKTRFVEMSEFEDIILLKAINFNSVCEHHMLPIKGLVDVAYIPKGSVVGISKIARVVDIYSRRLQIQERMTAEIAQALYKHLKPYGVAVRVSASHSCMEMRGVLKENSALDSFYYCGNFREDKELRQEFVKLISK